MPARSWWVKIANMNEVINILTKVGAIISNDHFVGVSGLHFDTYINKDALLAHTEEVSKICKIFAEKYKDKDIEVVAAPALGGIILSQWVAHHLTELTGREVLGVFTEKTSDKDQIFTRGYDEYVRGKRVLIVEDNVTTGGSVMKVVKAVQKAEGKVAGVCVMLNRDPIRVNPEILGIPLEALSELPITSYVIEDCPFCKSGVPINMKFGHGKDLKPE